MWVVHGGRTHLRTPPWVPGCPGKTKGAGTTMWCVIPLAGYFRTNHPYRLVVTAYGLGLFVKRWWGMTVSDSSAALGMTPWLASGRVGDDEWEHEQP